MSRLEFEKPLLELEGKLSELRSVTNSEGLNVSEEIKRIETKLDRLVKQTYSKLTPVQKVQIARHPDRPHFKDYAEELFHSFTPLAGDRLYGEDNALPGGLARFRSHSCIIMGQEKGSTTEERIKHNFGMARPEGYRKAQRLMHMAEQFQLPIITFIDTAGAYPGLGAEERGQSEAIAKSIDVTLKVKTPVIAVVIGEGGSGGAIAIGAADRIFMLEHSVYSVISPEGCASILWRSASMSDQAASALRLTAQDLKELKLIDSIIEEGHGGAHRNRDAVISDVGDLIESSLKELLKLSPDQLIKDRRKKFLKMSQI